jgi:hypothetical protein
MIKGGVRECQMDGRVRPGNRKKPTGRVYAVRVEESTCRHGICASSPPISGRGERIICDALSTAVFIHPKPEEFLRKYPEYGAVIVDEKGKYCLLGKTYGAAFVQ